MNRFFGWHEISVVLSLVASVGMAAGACSPATGANPQTTEPRVEGIEPTTSPTEEPTPTPANLRPSLDSLDVLVNGDPRELELSDDEYRLAGELSPQDSLTVNALVADDSDGELHFGGKVRSYDLGEPVEIKTTVRGDMLEAAFPITIEPEDGQSVEYRLSFEPTEEWGPQVVVENPTGVTGDVSIEVRVVDLNGSDTAELVSVEQEFNFQDTGDKEIDEYISNNSLEPFEIVRGEDGLFTVNFSTEWPGRFPLHLTAVDNEGHESTERVPVEVYWAENPIDVRGVAIEFGWHDGRGDLSLVPDLIDRAKKNNANYIQLAPQWVIDVHGTELFPCDTFEDTQGTCMTPSDQQLEAWIDYAHDQDFAALLKPHLVARNGNLYHLQPTSWQEWFDNYLELILRMAQIAEEHDVEMLSIGNELQSTHSQRQRWKILLEQVRDVYSGPITYADFSYWTDSPSRFPLEDELDILGPQFYYPGVGSNKNVIRNDDPTVEEMEANIERQMTSYLLPILDTLGSPAVAPELGRSPHDGTSYDPWGMWQKPVDNQEQVDYFEAAMRNVSRYLDGAFIWSYNIDPAVLDQGMDVRDKPVEELIRIWYAD